MVGFAEGPTEEERRSQRGTRESAISRTDSEKSGLSGVTDNSENGNDLMSLLGLDKIQKKRKKKVVKESDSESESSSDTPVEDDDDVALCDLTETDENAKSMFQVIRRSRKANNEYFAQKDASYQKRLEQWRRQESEQTFMNPDPEDESFAFNDGAAQEQNPTLAVDDFFARKLGGAGDSNILDVISRRRGSFVRSSFDEEEEDLVQKQREEEEAAAVKEEEEQLARAQEMFRKIQERQEAAAQAEKDRLEEEERKKVRAAEAKALREAAKKDREDAENAAKAAADAETKRNVDAERKKNREKQEAAFQRVVASLSVHIKAEAKHPQFEDVTEVADVCVDRTTLGSGMESHPSVREMSLAIEWQHRTEWDEEDKKLYYAAPVQRPSSPLETLAAHPDFDDETWKSAERAMKIRGDSAYQVRRGKHRVRIGLGNDAETLFPTFSGKNSPVIKLGNLTKNAVRPVVMTTRPPRVHVSRPRRPETTDSDDDDHPWKFVTTEDSSTFASRMAQKKRRRKKRRVKVRPPQYNFIETTTPPPATQTPYCYVWRYRQKPAVQPKIAQPRTPKRPTRTSLEQWTEAIDTISKTSSRKVPTECEKRAAVRLKRTVVAMPRVPTPVAPKDEKPVSRPPPRLVVTTSPKAARSKKRALAALASAATERALAMIRRDQTSHRVLRAMERLGLVVLGDSDAVARVRQQVTRNFEAHVLRATERQERKDMAAEDPKPTTMMKHRRQQQRRIKTPTEPFSLSQSNRPFVADIFKAAVEEKWLRTDEDRKTRDVALHFAAHFGSLTLSLSRGTLTVADPEQKERTFALADVVEEAIDGGRVILRSRGSYIATVVAPTWADIAAARNDKEPPMTFPFQQRPRTCRSRGGVPPEKLRRTLRTAPAGSIFSLPKNAEEEENDDETIALQSIWSRQPVSPRRRAVVHLPTFDACVSKKSLFSMSTAAQTERLPSLGTTLWSPGIREKITIAKDTVTAVVIGSRDERIEAVSALVRSEGGVIAARADNGAEGLAEFARRWVNGKHYDLCFVDPELPDMTFDDLNRGLDSVFSYLQKRATTKPILIPFGEEASDAEDYLRIGPEFRLSDLRRLFGRVRTEKPVARRRRLSVATPADAAAVLQNQEMPKTLNTFLNRRRSLCDSEPAPQGRRMRLVASRIFRDDESDDDEVLDEEDQEDELLEVTYPRRPSTVSGVSSEYFATAPTTLTDFITRRRASALLGNPPPNPTTEDNNNDDDNNNNNDEEPKMRHSLGDFLNNVLAKDIDGDLDSAPDTATYVSQAHVVYDNDGIADDDLPSHS